MTHGSKHKVKYNQYVLGRARKGSLIPSGEKPGTFGVKDPRCEPKSYVAQRRHKVMFIPGTWV